MDGAYEKVIEAVSPQSTTEFRPVSAQRRMHIMSDTDIEIILARRVQKLSTKIPPIDSLTAMAEHKRLKVIVATHSADTFGFSFSRKDFLHLLGEANGLQYDDCGRPELEVLSISLQSGNFASPSSITKQELQELSFIEAIQSVTFLFDPVRELFVLSDLIESTLLVHMLLLDKCPENIYKVLSLHSAESRFGRQSSNG